MLEDKSLSSGTACVTRAGTEIKKFRGQDEWPSIVVKDHPNARYGSWQVGDEILVSGFDMGYEGTSQVWMRIVEDTVDTTTGFVELQLVAQED